MTQAMTLVLAALSLLGLGIFGPTIASGLVAGAPQLGAGAAIGTVGAAAGAAIVGGGAVLAGGRMAAAGGLGAIRAGTSMGSAASTAYKLGQETSGSSSIGAGIGGVATAAKGAASQKMAQAGESLGLGAAAEAGRNAAWNAGVTKVPGSGSNSVSGSAPQGDGANMPAWAQQLRSEQTSRHHRQLALHAVRDGDRGGSGAAPDISEKED